MNKTLPAIGSFVFVPFGDGKRQVAHVEGHTRTGRFKARAWNKAKGYWMPNLRTLDPDQNLGSASETAAGLLPAPGCAGYDDRYDVSYRGARA